MSVTFFGTNDKGEILAPDGWTAEYENDPQYGRIQANSNPLELNVANDNFFHLMTLLGYDSATPEYCGSFGDGSLQDLREKIVFSLESIKAMPALDGGTETVEYSSPNHATMIYCGREAGYDTMRLTQLLKIVDAVIAVGGMLTYG